MTYPPQGPPPGFDPNQTYFNQPQQVCSWHPDRPTALACSRCGRPACPDCLTPASVGFHCRACVAESRATQRVATTVSGARAGEQPLVTYILIAINVLVFGVVSFQAGSTEATGRSSIWIDGALIPGAVADGDYYRLLTSGFLHAGLIHVAMNMISLYFIGPTLETILGRVRFGAVYLLSLLGGSAAVMLFSNTQVPTIGASGAIFGLLGALVVTFKRLQADLRQLGSVLLLNLVITFSVSGISWQAHLGGLIVGAAVGAAMVYPPREIRKKVQIATSVTALVLLAAVTVVRTGSIEPFTCKYNAQIDNSECGPPFAFD